MPTHSPSMTTVSSRPRPQVLQHLADPVAALAEMRRVTKAGGVVAARDSDFASTVWYPDAPALDRWVELYGQVTRRTGASPRPAGGSSRGRTRPASTDVTASASVWCFATPRGPGVVGSLWADRVTGSAFADQALGSGLADRDELATIAAAWRALGGFARRLVHPDLGRDHRATGLTPRVRLDCASPDAYP